MVCKNQKEVLAEIKKQMDIKEIQMKELAIMIGKSQQSLSQVFQIGNPKLSTLLEICNALNLNISISSDKGDTV